MQVTWSTTFSAIRDVAAIGGLLAATVAVITFLRSRTKVVLRAYPCPVNLTPGVQLLLKAGSIALDSRTRGDLKMADLPPEVNRLLNSVAGLDHQKAWDRTAAQSGIGAWNS